MQDPRIEGLRRELAPQVLGALVRRHGQFDACEDAGLTLRAVGGLTTAEIANAFLVPEATMAQRISRANQAAGHTGQQRSTGRGSVRGRWGPHLRCWRPRARSAGL